MSSPVGCSHQTDLQRVSIRTKLKTNSIAIVVGDEIVAVCWGFVFVGVGV